MNEKCPYSDECGILNSCDVTRCRVKELFDDFYTVEKLYTDAKIQIIGLKQENEELKKEVNRNLKQQEIKDNYLIPKLDEYKQCLDEIEEIVNYGSVSYNNHKELADFYEDKIEEIIKLIKQIKGM